MRNTIPWWLGGILMTILLLLTFSVVGADRPIGASTYIPYLAGLTFNLDPEKYTYLKEIQDTGAWEGVFLFGMLTGGFFSSIFITKTFRISLIPTAWVKYKNNSIKSRMLWSFVSGFFMIIGARLAGGCTSGHFMSGMGQIAVSAMIFGGVVMASLIITGHLFYNIKQKD
ncbi:MAG: hypothetical protein COA44_04925 [Arcobacter sp.]|nr:MAG: hypothetical protein COA44_04925 [Arcobacter sp.]